MAKSAKSAAVKHPASEMMSRSDAARLLGLSVRMLSERMAEWRARGYPWGPTKRGDKGKGWYPIAEIRRHLDATVGVGGNGSGNRIAGAERRDRLNEIAIATKELELQRELGQVLDFDDVAGLFSRVVAGAQSLCDAWPDKVAALLPEEVPADWARVRQGILESVAADAADLLNSLQELTRGDEDAKEGEENK